MSSSLQEKQVVFTTTVRLHYKRDRSSSLQERQVIFTLGETVRLHEKIDRSSSLQERHDDFKVYESTGCIYGDGDLLIGMYII